MKSTSASDRAPAPPATRPARTRSSANVAKGNAPHKKPGVKPYLTPEIAEKIVADLRLGIPINNVVEAYAGVDARSVRRWIQKGEEGIEPYVAFAVAFNQARAEGYVRLHKMALAGGKSSSMAAWMLERRDPANYSQRRQVELSGRDGAPITTNDVSQMSEAQLRAIVDGSFELDDEDDA